MGSEVFMTRTHNNAIVFGRNSKSFCCKEILCYPASEKGTTKVEIIFVHDKILLMSIF